ncbi:DUF3742 family protein [Pseudomonas sp. NBRC 100443]|uniref:DUF3742 family protein n=1 Tax=Pseudomonas sp. NBRC 100443 TaxID=1113665 RepID=UPI00255414F9|nr:DUF3742 family protein [Pseudomonas sp. NBRC 100443]
MKSSVSISLAERRGQTLGRVCRGYVRQERKVNGWLVGQGVSAGGATVLLWGVKLVVLGVLLYGAFWLAMLLLFAVTAVWTARNVDWEEEQPQWRNGVFGFGLYHPDGSRIDPYDPDDEQ